MRFCIIQLISFVLFSAVGGVKAATVDKDKPFQLVRAEVYRFERKDSCMLLNMNIDLTTVHLALDCTVYLIPSLRAGSDSLQLPPVMLNGPQSDLMYRRRKALGRFIEPVRYDPHVVLREGDHPLPRINYLKEVPYAPWMEQAEISITYKSYNNDARLVPLVMQIDRIPKDTVLVHDTVVIEKTVEKVVEKPVYRQTVAARPKAKEIVTEHAGYTADIYFPVGGMKILPEHELNREAWHTFVNELNTLRASAQNTVLGITVTGYSSPEGSYESNDRIAKRRAEALKSFLETQYNSALVEIRTEWTAEDWNRLAEMVRASAMPEKSKVLDIIEQVDVFNGRENRLKALDGGQPWQTMSKEMFPKLRRVSCRIGYLKRTEK